MSRLHAVALTAGLFLTVPVLAADPPKTEKPDVNPEQLNTTQAINYYVAAGWEKAGIKKPAAQCSDAEFLRRACLDLLGRIATVEEVLDFEQDRQGNKRQRLIKRLLYGVPQMKDGRPVLDKEGKPVAGPYTPKVDGKAVKVDGKDLTFDYPAEFAEHWANMWTVWLMSRTGHPSYRGYMQAWLWQQFYENRPYNEIVSDLVTATGSTNRNGAANFIVAHLGDPVPQNMQKEYGIHDAVPITSRVTRLFLGLQTQCTQCHDHPFNKEWVQSDFWGVNAFFRQTKRSATPTPRNMGNNNNNMMLQDKIELSDDSSLNSGAKIQFEQRNGTPASIRPLFLKDYKQAMDGEKSSKKLSTAESGKTRRQVLAEYLVSHDNFGPAYVNRLWGHLFGRGLNKEPSVDDFGSNNEVIHPELLTRLAGDLKKYNYDTKMVLEAICNTEVYSLSHVAAKGYEDTKFDAFFARMPLKALSPEALYESLTLATKSVPADKNERANRRDDWMSKLVRNFGDDEGNEGTFNGTVVQALLMMNGRELNKEVTRTGGVVEEAMKKHIRNGQVSVNGVLDELFLTALNRHATQAELAALKDIQDGAIVSGRDDKKDDKKDDSKKDDPKKPDPKKPDTKKPDPKAPPTLIMGTGPADKKFYQDVFWALLNTTEFMLNH